ncbi:hypothetical protein BaRGS_00038380, partial [Batillaria attramentaria]
PHEDLEAFLQFTWCFKIRKIDQPEVSRDKKPHGEVWTGAIVTSGDCHDTLRDQKIFGDNTCRLSCVTSRVT